MSLMLVSTLVLHRIHRGCICLHPTGWDLLGRQLLMGKHRRLYYRVGEIERRFLFRCHVSFGLDLDGRVATETPSIFRSNFSRLVFKLDVPCLGWGSDGRVSYRGVDEVQADSSFAFSVGLLAVLAVGSAFVALEMSFSASQAAGPYSFRLGSSGGGGGGGSSSYNICRRS